MAEPIPECSISSHAIAEMRRRGINEDLVRRVLAAPEQREAVRPGRDVLHSRVEFERKTYLVRVVVDVEVTYDHKTDTLTVILKEGVQVAESDEDKPGVILDYDVEGNLLSLEVLDASRRVTDARKIEYQMTG